MQSNPLNKPLKGSARADLLQELYQRYGTSRGNMKKFQFYRKKFLWIFFVEGTNLLKRILDIVASVALFIFFSPIMALVAILIKWHDGGPVIYLNKRVGKWGKEFDFPKFRSMELDADLKRNDLRRKNRFVEDIKFKLKKDPRTTWIGKIIRKTSLDELPQLWCILKGEMSLVGPRPPLPEEVSRYNLEQRRRLDITPGLTCIWQVSGRAELPFNEQVKLDVEYIESQSFWLDIKLLLLTVPAVLSGKGAY